MRTRFRPCGPRWLSFLVLVLALLALLPSQAAAQLTSDRSLWIHRADLSNPDAAVVVVSALQVSWRANQEPIMGVTPLQIGNDGFEVYLDKLRLKTVRAQRFSDSPEGIDIVLAIDISGSVYSQFALLQDAVKAFVRRIRPDRDRVAILTFGSDTRTSEFHDQGQYSPFTNNIADLEAAISQPPSKERMAKTVLYKALTEAIELAGRGRQSGSRAVEQVVVVLSDGHDEGVGYDIGNPINAAKEHQVPVFALGLPEPATKNGYHDVLERIARESGAVFVPIRDTARLSEVYEKLDTLLKSQYVLTVQVPPEMRDGRQHVVQVVATNQGAALSARFDARTQVTPGAAAPPVPFATPAQPAAKQRGGSPAGGRPGLPPWWVRYRWWLAIGGGAALIAAAAVIWRWWVLWRKNARHEDDGSEIV